MMASKFPDWNDFKAKANGACRDRFEDLCRMLFCNELGIDQGSEPQGTVKTELE